MPAQEAGVLMKARIFFQVYEEGKEETGEYITYEQDIETGSDLQEFSDKVNADMDTRIALFTQGKSMLSGR